MFWNSYIMCTYADATVSIIYKLSKTLQCHLGITKKKRLVYRPISAFCSSHRYYILRTNRYDCYEIWVETFFLKDSRFKHASNSLYIPRFISEMSDSSIILVRQAECTHLQYVLSWSREQLGKREYRDAAARVDVCVREGQPAASFPGHCLPHPTRPSAPALRAHPLLASYCS